MSMVRWFAVLNSIKGKIAPDFLVTKRERVAGARAYRVGRSLVSYYLAKGDPSTARYEVVGTPLDLLAMARRLGVHVSQAEIGALSGNEAVAT